MQNNIFFSKHNQVYPVLRDGGAAVEKHFTSARNWQQERDLYQALSGQLSIPSVLEQSPSLLVTSFCPGNTLLHELVQQETGTFDPAPWHILADWLIACDRICQQLPTEGNLRNFLWDGEKIIGLDLESFRSIPLSDCGATLIAALLAYEPIGTAAKRSATAILAQRLSVSDRAIDSSSEHLQMQRRRRPSPPCSGIILAGGHSSRMGQNKAFLSLGGQSLLAWHIRKMQILGIDDIMISGASAPEKVRQIPDLYLHRGPLGGLHACLQAARHPRCLVLSVDTPLVPISILAALCRTHQQGITVLEHCGRQEPLIGVYDSQLSSIIEPLIIAKSAPVQMLSQYVSWHTYPYLGPELFLKNCNTPADYASICDTVTAYETCGILLR